MSKEPKKDLRKAVALEYQKTSPAPKVTAKGKGEVAERIIQLAQLADVPLYEDPDLVEVLQRLDINELIPPQLYQVVAETLAFVYLLNQERKRELV